MKTISLRRTLVYVALFAQSLLAQSADKVLAQHIAALGSASALRARANVQFRGEARDLADGARGSFTLSLRAPNWIYVEFASSDHGWSEAHNGSSAWRRDSAQELKTLSGPDARHLRAMGYFLNSQLVDYKKDKWSPRLTGTSLLDGRNADVVEIASDSVALAGTRYKLYFDVITHMLLKQEQADGTAFIQFGDYRAVNGVMEPFHFAWSQGGQLFDIAIDQVRYNAPLDAHLFDYPGAKVADSPDLGKLFQDLLRHQTELDGIRQTYSCTVDEVEESLDGKGKLTKTTTERYYQFYLGSHRFRKHIATDGKPLSDKEAKKEDERIAKEQRQAEADQKKKEERRQRAKEKREGPAARDGEPPPADPDEDNQDFTRAILQVMQFTNLRREPFRGQEVLVFDFSLKPDYRPRGLMESLVSKFTGTIWVDERDRQVARAQARLASSFKIAGGVVASLNAGSAFLLEQEKVNGEVWMPIFEEDHFSGHLFFLSQKANQTDRFSDYKKFTANSKVTFGEIPH